MELQHINIEGIDYQVSNIDELPNLIKSLDANKKLDVENDKIIVVEKSKEDLDKETEALLKNVAEKIELVKSQKLSEAEAYGNSAEVDGVRFHGILVVVNAELRAKLRERIEVEEAEKKDVTTLAIGGFQVPVPINMLKEMLLQIAIRAKTNFDILQEHKRAIVNLKNLEELEGYDYRANYLPALEF